MLQSTRMQRFPAMSTEDRITILIFIAEKTGQSLDGMFDQSACLDLASFKAFCRAALSLPR